MNESVFDKISAAYYELTAAEKRTADYIMANRGSSQYLSIAELAEYCGVAEATVSRFCRRLGYKGFNAFRLALANASYSLTPEAGLLSGPVESTDSFEQMCRKLYAADQEAMHQTLELVDAETIGLAVDMLYAARRVVCMGQGGSMLMAQDTSHLFSTVSGKFSALADSHAQMIAAVNMCSEDVIFFFSFSGATKDLVETLQTAKSRGVKTLLVTRFLKSPGAQLADLVLPCGANESPLQLGSIPAKIAQLFLLDVLFSEFCRRDMECCRESRERLAAALESKHL